MSAGNSSHTTGWEIVNNHVIPLHDLRPHSITDCWCQPGEDDGVIVHNSLRSARPIRARGAEGFIVYGQWIALSRCCRGEFAKGRCPRAAKGMAPSGFWLPQSFVANCLQNIRVPAPNPHTCHYACHRPDRRACSGGRHSLRHWLYRHSWVPPGAALSLFRWPKICGVQIGDVQ
jgi:hypothetical protein